MAELNSKLKAIIHLPSSKSESNRALIIRALCEKSFPIKNLSEAEDTKILSEILNHKSQVLNHKKTFDVGAAGTAMRFLTAYFSIQEGKEIVLTGTERMKNRPVKILVDALRKLGADIEYLGNNGFPPLRIKGKKLQGGKIILDGSVSSQYISALLMLAPCLKNGLTIEFSGEIISRPYIAMTLKIMQHFGINCNTGFKNELRIAHQKYQSKSFTVESDWSAASYWYEMAAFSDDVDLTLTGLKKQSLQGDAAVAKIFENFGVKTKFMKNGVHLSKIINPESKTSSERCRTTVHPEFNCSDCPDLAQTIAVTCAGLNIPARLTGLKTLRIKETDRISALQNELKKIKVNTEIINDELHIKPSRVKHFTTAFRTDRVQISTYDDHRMAMAFAPLVIKFTNLKIENPEVVKKSYPGFWNDLKKVMKK